MPEPTELTRLFRAASEAEYADLQSTGRFRPGRGTLEGKWFADTVDGAAQFGAFLYGGGPFRIAAADVPVEVMRRAVRRDNLDKCGPATFIEEADLPTLIPVLDFDHAD